MKVLTSHFLRAKHWQVFLLLLGIPMLYFVQMMVALFGPQPAPGDTGFTTVLNEPFLTFGLFPYVIAYVTLVYFGWIWALGSGLRPYIPSTERRDLFRFRLAIIVPLLFILGLMGYLVVAFGTASGNSSFSLIGPYWTVFIPLNVLVLACLCYCLYFAAKTLKSAELQRSASFRECIGEFLLLWFCAIGIWIIQPKANRLAKKPSFKSS